MPRPSHIRQDSVNMAIQNGHNRPSILSAPRDHSELLDVIDLLRSEGVSNYVPLPQIIVCGDQSSGKSSVLEAVSGVRFPTRDSLCTRFATELILRKKNEIKVSVGITPGEDRSEEEKATLLAFKYPDARLEDFPSLVEAAKMAMGLNSGTKSFSGDVLRVEVTGPNQTNLTLVDLPGLIHAESKQQNSSDISLVKSLVEGYMDQSRSIILAVVSAKNDLANQVVTQLARKVDPKGLRTMGIITKPDTLHVGSESESNFVELAKNEEVKFRLGWHVLKNRDYDQKDFTMEERDNNERVFFSRGVWTTLPISVLGLDPLKPRLNAVLRDQIIAELPSLVRDIDRGIEDCQNRIAKLGEARATVNEQRRYLMQVGQNFGYLIKAALGGDYADDFFGSALGEEGYCKRLRAVVQNLLIGFESEMRSHGHEREIVDEVVDDGNDDTWQPPKISREEYISEVQTLMSRNRGRELPGTYNPMIIGDMFFRQSRPWKNIVRSSCQAILDATRLCIDLSLVHLADDQTRSGLHREVVDPAVEDLSRILDQKVTELMKPHQKGHAITYNRSFIEAVKKARENHEEKYLERHANNFFGHGSDAKSTQLYRQGVNTRDLAKALGKKTEQEAELYACSEVIYCMEAYYEVAMKVAVDNIAVLGVEHSLLDKLSGLLSSDVVMNLEDSVVQGIAAEREDSRIERAQALSKQKTLQRALDTLRRHGRHRLEVLDFDFVSEVNGDKSRSHHANTTAEQIDIVQKAVKAEVATGSPERTPKAEAAEPVSPLSPFDGGGFIRPEAKRSSSSKKKKLASFGESIHPVNSAEAVPWK